MATYKETFTCSMCGNSEQKTITTYGYWDANGSTMEPENCSQCKAMEKFVPEAYKIAKNWYDRSRKIKAETEAKHEEFLKDHYVQVGVINSIYKHHLADNGCRSKLVDILLAELNKLSKSNSKYSTNHIPKILVQNLEQHEWDLRQAITEIVRTIFKEIEQKNVEYHNDE